VVISDLKIRPCLRRKIPIFVFLAEFGTRFFPYSVFRIFHIESKSYFIKHKTLYGIFETPVLWSKPPVLGQYPLFLGQTPLLRSKPPVF